MKRAFPLKPVCVSLSVGYVRVQNMFDLNDDLWVLYCTYKVSLAETRMGTYTVGKKDQSKLLHGLINIIFHGRQHTGPFLRFPLCFDIP